MTKDQISDDKLILFHEVIKLLKEYNVNYWLDQGSLLGAVRNNAFLKWDHDVDMGAWYTDFNTIKKIGKKLTGMGAHVSLFRYVVKIRFSRNGISSMPVNIRFYYRKEGYAYSEFWSVMEKKSSFHKIVKKRMNFARKNTDRINASGEERDLKNIISILLLRMLFKVTVYLREVFKVRRVIFRVDENFFLNFRVIKLYGIDLNIPNNSEKYLEFKYGKDWVKPVKEWVWWRDDGAIYKNEIFKKSIFGFKKKLNFRE